MSRLRTPTALFLALTLLPAGLLGWLGFRATSPWIEELRRGALDLARQTAEVQAAQLPRHLAAIDRAAGDRLREAAAVLAAQLPFGSGGLLLRELEQRFPGALVVVGAGGERLLPRGPGGERPTWLLELPRSDAIAQQAGAGPRAGSLGDPLGEARLEQAGRLEAPVLRIGTLAALLGGDPDAAAERLGAESLPDLVAAGPRPVEVLSQSRRGLEVVARLAACGGLYEVAATEAGRRAWLAAAGVPPAELAAQELRVREEAGEPVLANATALPGGCSLRLLRDPAALLAALQMPGSEPACSVEYVSVPARTALPAVDASDEATTAWGRIAVRVRHLGLPELESQAWRQRWLTGIGIALLLLSMLAGLWLVRRALAKEHQARRLRDDFIANVSHELKTPLTSLRLHADLLAADATDAATRRRHGEVAQAEGARLSALVEDLLDFAALERGRRRLEPEPVDLAAAARAAAATWSVRAGQEGVVLGCEAAAEEPALMDPIALQRVLTNLMQNAFRHGRPARDGGPARIRLLVGPGPCLEVRDNGRGVAAADRDDIFTRFGRASSDRAGLGLGLALSRELTEACGGRLSCADTGTETVFRLELPQVPEPESMP